MLITPPIFHAIAKNLWIDSLFLNIFANIKNKSVIHNKIHKADKIKSIAVADPKPACNKTISIFVG